MINNKIASLSLIIGLSASGVAMAQTMSDWEALVEAAQEEGEVNVILGGNTPGMIRHLMADFEEEFGIKVNFQTGSSRQHAERVLAERQLGRYTVDAWMGGANTPLSVLIPNNALAPIRDNNVLVHPDVVDESQWFNGKHHYTDPEFRYIFTWGASPAQPVVINTDMVDPSEITSYWDIIDPKWEGEIVMTNPGLEGGGATVGPMVLNEQIGYEWFEALANEMNPTVVRDQRQGAEWVAVGRFPIGLLGFSSEADDLAAEGFPIQSWMPAMEEGEALTSSAANIMYMADAPNPNAAKLWINWALTEESQQKFVNAIERMPSLRRDVSQDGVLPPYRIDPNANYYVAFSEEEYINRQDEILSRLREMMTEAGY